MSPGSADDQVREFRLAAPFRARLMGIGLMGIGLILLLVTVIVAVAHLSLDIISALVVAVVVLVVLLGNALTRRWYVVRMDQHGYRVRLVRGAGVKLARWSDVLDLATVEVAGARCARLRLRDGGTTTVPVDIIEGDPAELVREFGRRLERSAGKRA